MATDDLSAPLGHTAEPQRRSRASTVLAYGVAALLGLFLLAFTFAALVMDNPLGGEPVVVAKLEKVVPPPRPLNEKPAEEATAPEAEKRAPAPETSATAATKTVTIIDGTSGRRQDVTVRNPVARSESDSRLIEQTRHGAIPKIAQDGTRPSDVYAKAKAQPKADEPKIAIVVSGLGTGATRTVDGLRKLPAAVTLGFAPYGKDLDQWVARANDGGHELLLQVGMEPFDYPENDPGPQTLLTTLAAEQNIDRLHWFMSRFRGYIGVASYMGTRFTATEQAFSPVLREVSKRGLIYFEDGASPRSLAAQIAGANNAAFAKADLVIDASPTAADIDAALGRLEQLARERGRAIGVANALPVSIDRIAAWAKQLEGSGIRLVPLSVVTNRPKSS